MNGPSEQTLEQFGTCFEVPRNLEPFKFNELNLTSENIITDEIYVDKGKSYQPVLRLYNTKQSTATAEGNYLVSVGVIEPADDNDGYVRLGNMHYSILPKDDIAVVYFVKDSNQESGKKPNVRIRLKLFKYHSTSNQVSKLADTVHDIDHYFLAGLQRYHTFRSSCDQDISFKWHRNRIFCMTFVGPSKTALQVYCFYKNRSIPIGGTNCNRPGLYIMTKKGFLNFYDQPDFVGVIGTGWTSQIDFNREVIAYKFFEWTLSF